MHIPLTPIAKPRMTRSDKWKQRKRVMEYWAFKHALRPYKIILPDIYKITFFMPMPASWSEKKKRMMEGLPHRVRPDKDNMEKAILDALHIEDAHIWSGWAEKRWARTGSIKIEDLTGVKY
jgi:Holliday junction resolvase RusA-like endonuclease